MATLMVVQSSGRKKGYTASLMEAAVERLKEKAELKVEVFHLHNYKFGPCTSCFSCITKPGSGCVLDDDWGRKGRGILYKAFKRANGLLMVDPVHGWGISAMGHLFMERIYPTFWEGIPYGLPFASISCASNQGFQYRAKEEYCKFCAACAFRYIGGLDVHVAYIEEAREEARELADRLADAALEDERNGRKKPTDEDIFLMYNGTPWDIVDGYLRNLTHNTFRYEDALPLRALSSGSVDNPEARSLMEKVSEHLKLALEHYHSQNREAAARELAVTAKFWTNSTYKQYCEKYVKASIPKTYRPLDEL